MIGPGKYDDLCTYVKDNADAKGSVVIVVEGNKGSGFSCQLRLVDMIILPMMLRDLANHIESDYKKGKL